MTRLDLRDEELISQYKNGQSLSEIAMLHKANHITIRNRLLSNKVILRSKGQKLNLNEGNIIKQYKSGQGTNTIARLCGASPTTIRNRLLNNNIVLRPLNNKLDLDERDIIKRYKSGQGAPEIGRLCGVSETCIYRRLFKNSIPLRPQGGHRPRTHYLNENIFDTIDTSEKAYWLGFLAADGNIYIYKKSFRISLESIDRDHLEKFQKFLGSDYFITKTKKSPFNNGKIYIIYRLDLFSKRLANSLIKLGITPRKSLTLQFPNLERRFVFHFARGFVDGDGYWSKGYDCLSFGVLGPKLFLQKLQGWLMDECNLNKVKITKREKIFCLHYGGSKQVFRIINCLYKDATIFLERKARYLNRLGQRLENFKRSEVHKPFQLLMNNLLKKEEPNGKKIPA